jgi:hypothetical protein
MTYVDHSTYTPHWLDDARCQPGTHDNRHDGETDWNRDLRHRRAKLMCTACPVDHARCLDNGRQMRADGVFAGVVLEDGKVRTRGKPGPKPKGNAA